ncbi:MAG TPA: carboxypeptidase-like regulatory domain-containing protein [Longimicrobiales bacterium]|nr:carboxypeptidase-like regulatory domain-containing protein [Longimicrobiales bacterium]
MRTRHSILFAVALFCIASGAAGQESAATVEGRVVGPDDAPLANQNVVLHRVQRQTGETVAEAVTGEDGRFTLPLPAGSDTAAVYFVATRYAGELYIGAPFRAGIQEPGDQTIQVGVPGTSATALLDAEGGATPMAQPVGRPLTNRNWLLLIIPLVGVAAVALYALIPRSRIPADRAALIRIAELDERMSTAPDAQRESLLEERSRLTAQLRTG